MSISGGPTRPVYELASGQAVNAGATLVLGPVDCRQYDTLVVEVITDQTTTLTLRGTVLDEPPATPPLVKDARGGANLTYSALSVNTGANGDAFLLNVAGLGWAKVYLVNGSGATATVTCRAALK
jgi:hypothetical protein